MAKGRKEIKCPWCGEVIPASEVQVKRYKNDYGTVIDRRCPKCHRALAAYLEEEGGFLDRIRTF